jgi:HK97 family phage portal protein
MGVSLVDRITARRDGRREARADNPTGDIHKLLRRRAGARYAGVSVTPDTAKRHGAVFACTDLIATLISTLPVHEFRKSAEARQQLPDPPIISAPDGGEVPATAWRYMVLESLLLRGNAYGLILAWENGWPSRIRMVHPDSVTVRQEGRNGPVSFRLEGTPVTRYQPLGDGNKGQLWHVPAYVVAGCPVGLSPINYARLTIALGLAAQQFGAQWYEDGAHPTALLQAEDPQNQINPTAAQLIKDEFLEATHGSREPVVLPHGLKYLPISVNADESQFLDSIGASVVDVARFFRVPPEEIGSSSGNSMTYANIESRGIALLSRCIGPWITRLEEALTALRPRPRYIKINPDALLRTELLTRYRAHGQAIRDGWKSVDEVRLLEDLAPLPDGQGDRYLWPPWRMQLDNTELEAGADNEPAGQPAPSTNGAGSGA